ncbi:MAG: hypothetical protein JXQ99_10715 [Hyphomicrobiaceae bacterium]
MSLTALFERPRWRGAGALMFGSAGFGHGACPVVSLELLGLGGQMAAGS